MGGFRAISVLRPTSTETLSSVIETVWTLGPLCQMRFPEKGSVAYLEVISQKSSRHFCARDLFICEEYIIVLNYGL